MESVVASSFDDWKAIKYCQAQFSQANASKSMWRRLFIAKKVHVDGVVVKEMHRVHTGQQVAVYDMEKVLRVEAPCTILYKDSDVMAVMKEAGVGERDIYVCYPEWLPVYHLERALLLFAANNAVLQQLKYAFHQSQLTCTFRCICRGNVTPTSLQHCTINVLQVITTANAGYITKVDILPDASFSRDANTIGISKPLRQQLQSQGLAVIGEGHFTTRMGGHKFNGTFMALIRVSFVHPVTGQCIQLDIAEPSKFNNFITRERKFSDATSLAQVYHQGQVMFCGYLFLVSQATLVPRPSSQTLVHAARHVIKDDDKHTVLDAGTGSGCLLLSILLNHPGTTGVGIDLSEDALSIAHDNAQRLCVADRAHFLNADMYALQSLEGSFDTIVCNPPYLSHSKAKEYFHDIQEPHLALIGGDKGHESYVQLEQSIRTSHVLKPGGVLILEVGNGKQSIVHDIFRHWQHVSTWQDDQGMDRCFVFRAATLMDSP